MYDMLVQWVKTGKGWVTSFEEDFQYHKVCRQSYLVTVMLMTQSW